MATKTPSYQVRFQAAPRALDAPTRALLIAPIGAGGQASPAQVYKVLSEDDISALFGSSEINEAVAAWFDEGLQESYDLYALGVDSTGWIANTWTLTVTGTAASAGSLVVRFAEYSIPVTVSKGASQDEIATAVQAAVTASQAPVTAVVDGINLNQVNLAAQYTGLHTQRIPLSVDLYRDRGELGVEGITTAIVNNEDGAGEPTFASGSLVEAYDVYMHAFRGVAWLDAVEAWLEAGWQDRNNFGHAIVALSGAQTTTVALGAARNDKHTSYVAISDAPIFELSATVRALGGIVRQLEEQGTPNISGQQMLIRIPPIVTALDSEALLDAGVTPLRSVRTTVTAVRFVTSYRETNGAEDLVQFDIGVVLSLAEFGRLQGAMYQRHLGKGLVADDTPVTPQVARFVLTPNQLLGELREILKGLWRRAVIYAADEAAVAQAVTSIAILEENGQAVGYEALLDITMVRKIVFFKALVLYR